MSRRAVLALAILLTGAASGCASMRTAFERYVHPDHGWAVDLPPGGWKAHLLPDGGIRLRRPDVVGEIAIDLLPRLGMEEATRRLRAGALESSFESWAYPDGIRAAVWRLRFSRGSEVAAAFADPKGRGTFVVRRDHGGPNEAALAEAFDLVLRRIELDPSRAYVREARRP